MMAVVTNPKQRTHSSAQAPSQPFLKQPMKNVPYGSLPWEKMDLYFSVPNAKKVVVWLHGGGGISGSENFPSPTDFPWTHFLQQGMDLAAVRYGLVGKQYQGFPNGALWPHQHESVGRAIAELRAAYGYTHVCCWGNSWGGMLAGIHSFDSGTPAAERMDSWVAWGVPTDATSAAFDASFKGTLPTYVDPVTYPQIPGGYLHSALTTQQLEDASPKIIAENSGLHVPTYFSYYEAVGSLGSIASPHDGAFGPHMSAVLATNGQANLESQQELGLSNFDAATIAAWVKAL